MQFTVPQFIDIESKIIGPLSVRQFVTMLVAGVFIYLDYLLFFNVNFFLFAVIAVLLFALAGLFAFLRLNGRPFHYFLLNLFNTFKEPRLRVWSKSFNKRDFKYKEEKPRAPVIIPYKKPLTASKLAQISLIVDTGGAYQEGEIEEQDKK